MDRKEILAHFKEDTKNHRLVVENDNGVFRHLHFARGRSSIYHFTLTTWPGHLCISGDCGTYVFSRLHDMLDFFRMDKHDFMRSEGELSINPGYWAEKLQHGGGYRRELYTEWSSSAFEEQVQEMHDNWLESFDPEDYDSEEEAEAAKADVLSDIKDLKNASSDEWEAVAAVREFYSDHIDLQDFWESGECREMTHGFIWCLYAIAWGIQQYDIRRLAEKAMDKFFVYRLAA